MLGIIASSSYFRCSANSELRPWYPNRCLANRPIPGAHPAVVSNYLSLPFLWTPRLISGL
jgi:hypothetical protein